MIRTRRPMPAAKVKSLDQQKTDFTSEGAPPPGKVGTAIHAPAAPVMPTLDPSKVVSEPMQQAYRDITRGLKDTDRGAEAGRTYKKLKGSAD